MRQPPVWTAVGDVPSEVCALAGLGRCRLAIGQIDEGIAHLRESRAIRSMRTRGPTDRRLGGPSPDPRSPPRGVRNFPVAADPIRA